MADLKFLGTLAQIYFEPIKLVGMYCKTMMKLQKYFCSNKYVASRIKPTFSQELISYLNITIEWKLFKLIIHR